MRWKWRCGWGRTKIKVFIKENVRLVIELPTIAQLVERPTVEVTQLSGGPWFESGLSELFYTVEGRGGLRD